MDCIIAAHYAFLSQLLNNFQLYFGAPFDSFAIFTDAQFHEMRLLHTVVQLERIRRVYTGRKGVLSNNTSKRKKWFSCGT